MVLTNSEQKKDALQALYRAYFGQKKAESKKGCCHLYPFCFLPPVKTRGGGPSAA